MGEIWWGEINCLIIFILMTVIGSQSRTEASSY